MAQHNQLTDTISDAMLVRVRAMVNVLQIEFDCSVEDIFISFSSALLEKDIVALYEIMEGSNKVLRVAIRVALREARELGLIKS